MSDFSLFLIILNNNQLYLFHYFIESSFYEMGL
jgi:hypothetical protein